MKLRNRLTSNGRDCLSESSKSLPRTSSCCQTLPLSSGSTSYLKTKTLVSLSVDATSSFDQEQRFDSLSGLCCAQRSGIITRLHRSEPMDRNACRRREVLTQPHHTELSSPIDGRPRTGRKVLSMYHTTRQLALAPSQVQLRRPSQDGPVFLHSAIAFRLSVSTCDAGRS